MPGTLDCYGQLTLMPGAGTGHTAGNDFRPLGKDLAAVFADGLIVDILNFVDAERADFSAGFSAAAIPSCIYAPMG